MHFLKHKHSNTNKRFHYFEIRSSLWIRSFVIGLLREIFVISFAWLEEIFLLFTFLSFFFFFFFFFVCVFFINTVTCHEGIKLNYWNPYLLQQKIIANPLTILICFAVDGRFSKQSWAFEPYFQVNDQKVHSLVTADNNIAAQKKHSSGWIELNMVYSRGYTWEIQRLIKKKKHIDNKSL